jgi:hypothetical protein
MSLAPFESKGHDMSLAAGFIISFAIVAVGGVGLSVFAIWHRERPGVDQS